MLGKKRHRVIARQQGRELTEIASEMEADLVAGSSLKAALDLNWDDPQEKVLALGMVLAVLSQVETHLELESESKSHPVIRSRLEAAQQIEAEDVEVDDHGIEVQI